MFVRMRRETKLSVDVGIEYSSAEKRVYDVCILAFILISRRRPVAVDD